MSAELWGLTVSAFLAATLLPGGSEIYLIALLQGGEYSPVLLVVLASVGNTLGSMTSWAIGRWLPRPENLEQGHARALGWLRRHGAPALLAAWIPIIGDPICVAAGWLRIAFVPALLFTAIGKTARYALLTLPF